MAVSKALASRGPAGLRTSSMDMKPRRPPSFKVRPRGASVAFLTSKFNALAAGSETPSSGARRRTRRSGSSRRTTVVSNGPHVAKARMRFETDVPEAVYDDAGPLQQQLQPNHSFLWGGRVSAPPEKEEEEEEMPYDDVGPLVSCQTSLIISCYSIN